MRSTTCAPISSARSRRASSDGTTIECPCHGSQFDVTSGEAIGGPAVDPVDVFETKVEDGELKVLVNDVADE